MQGRSNISDKKDIVFKIQAYASKIFNDYLHTRTKKGLEAIDGDLVIDTNRQTKHQFGIYQATTNTVKLFDDTQKSEAFFRYPNTPK